MSACALLFVFGQIERDRIVRSRDPEKLANCEFVCDVGGVYDATIKRFDHHQLEYEGEFSSAGMILKYLADEKIISKSLYDFFNRAAVIGIDAHDNGKVMQKEGVCTFSHVIAGFVPVEYSASNEAQNAAFSRALDFAIGYFERLKNRYDYIEACGDKVAKAMEPNEEILLFDEALPWVEKFFDHGGETHPALFVVMPSGEHWKLRGIPPNTKDKMGVRVPLPEEWAGIRDDALRQASGIEGAIFCHKGRFISIWETKEDALKACKQVLERRET